MVKITGTLGSMTFRSHMAAWEFRTKIESWPGFATKQDLTREEAVDYHLAYCRGGAAAVLEQERILIARKHTEAMAEAQRRALYEMEKQQRYAMARMAPRDSDLYRSHYDMWHPSYRWGS